MTPNLLVILTDQERDAGPFDAPGMAAFHAHCLPQRRRLAATGVQFTQHRIASAACVPSRASLFTGLSPWRHGVGQTDGFAKLADDDGMRWLAPDGPPTLGHRLEAAGYETVYIGKWHISHALGDDDPLAPWGFHGWQGPEPHGPDPQNAGLARDPAYLSQALAWLEQRSRRGHDRPFLLVVSLVNPHDVVFWPQWALHVPGAVDLDGIPKIEAGPSDALICADEAPVLSEYRRHYPSAYGPRSIVEQLYRRRLGAYRRAYAALIRRSDRLLGQLLDGLEATGLAEQTAVLFSSDHGELLGAHGGLHQKWYNAFEETLRVPLILRAPGHRAVEPGTTRAVLSTHLDLVPTLLGLAGIDTDADRDADPLPGRDLLASAAEPERDSYFVTFDHILDGLHREAAFGRRFPRLGALWPMRYPGLSTSQTAVEALVARERGLWKLVRSFDPERPDPARAPGHLALFDLDDDPAETRNRSADPDTREIRDAMLERLARARVHHGYLPAATRAAQSTSSRTPT